MRIFVLTLKNYICARAVAANVGTDRSYNGQYLRLDVLDEFSQERSALSSNLIQ